MTLAERIAQTESRLAAYIAAESSILAGGQSYAIGNRSLTKADLQFITKEIVRLYGELVVLNRGNNIVQQRVVPRDI